MPELLATPLNANDLIQALTVMYRIRRSSMVWGPPGIGKSRLMKQLADKLGIALKDVRALLMNPVDVNGLPHVRYRTAAMEAFAKLLETPDVSQQDFMANAAQIYNQTSEQDLYGTTIWSRPGFLPAQGSGILLFDEINAAAVEVMAALYQVMLDFTVGDHKLAPGWVPFAAGNRLTDRGVAHKMPTPLSDRLFHYDLIVEWEPWRDWAANNNIHPLVLGYLQFSLRDHGRGIADNSDLLKDELTKLVGQPMLSIGEVKRVVDDIAKDHSDDAPVGMLHRFNPKDNERSFPTPRSWEMVSEALEALETAGMTGTRIEEAVIAGKVGPTAAKEMLSFAITFRQGFTIDGVTMNPDVAMVPDEPSMRCAVAASLARHANDRNIKQIGTYIERLPEEYQMLFVKAATARDQTLNATRWVTTFKAKNADIMA